MSPDPAVRSRRRVAGAGGCCEAFLLVCLPAIMATLARGQANLLLLLLLGGVVGSVVRGQHWRAGLCLGGAICLKVFPAFLLAYVVWRRNWHCLGGCGLGLFLGLVAIPSEVLGPARATRLPSEVCRGGPVAGAGSGLGQIAARGVDGHCPHRQPVLASRRAQHIAPRPDNAPPETISSSVRTLATTAGLLLTGVTLLAGGSRPRAVRPREVLFFGTLLVNMLSLCPVCHLSYFCLLLPLVMALVKHHWLPARQAVEARGWRESYAAQKPEIQGAVRAVRADLPATNVCAYPRA